MEKILIIDDEKATLSMLSLFLGVSGYEVLTAESGSKGIEIFNTKRPSLVLTDIKMPGMDGIEVLQKIKSEDPNAEVIMMTGHGDMDLTIQSLKHDASDYITKPINTDMLELALKKANAKISMKKKIEEYTANLEQLVQSMALLSHDVKNILEGLEGGAYVVDAGLEDKDIHLVGKGWNIVRNHINEVSHLVQNILYSRNREPPKTEVCSIHDTVKDVIALCKEKAASMGIELNQELNPALPLTRLDSMGIRRMLTNLIWNALSACKRDKKKEDHRITVRADFHDEAHFRLEVEDNGTGMDASTGKKVFKEVITSKGSGGTGLGLLVVDKIVKEHGGRVEVSSVPGQGSRFRVILAKTL
jgi:signal transduction histidine kinase